MNVDAFFCGAGLVDAGRTRSATRAAPQSSRKTPFVGRAGSECSTAERVRQSAERPIARAAALLGGVECLVHEAVGELVVLATDGGVRDAADTSREPRGLQRQLAQSFVLDLVLAPHLLHEQL